jgi:hypothetical protein
MKAVDSCHVPAAGDVETVLDRAEYGNPIRVRIWRRQQDDPVHDAEDLALAPMPSERQATATSVNSLFSSRCERRGGYPARA